MQIKRLIVSEFSTNCYVVYYSNIAIIIDPGDNFKKIKNFIQDNNLDVKAILLTHGHCDHIGAIESLYQNFQCPIYLHEEDHVYLTEPKYNLSTMLGKELKITVPVLKAPEYLTIENFNIHFIHLPGHTPGSCMIEFINEKVIFSGDVLFKNAIGRFDFPLSSKHDTKSTIMKILAFDHDAKVLPGHGDMTTIKEEQKNNPFLNVYL